MMTMKFPLAKPLLVLAVAGLGSFFFTGCADDEQYATYRGRPAYYDEGPGPEYYDTGYADEGDDFYYVGGVPYSHSFGVLVFRDGGYYYRHGGGYVRYERHGHHRGNGNDRYYANGKYDNHGREKYIKYDNHGRPKSPEGYQNQAVVNQRYQQQRYQQQQHGGFQHAAATGHPLTPQQQAELAKRKKKPQPPQQ